MKTEKWKIQVPAVSGWADLKTSEDDRPHVDEHYDTKEEAVKEAADMMLALEDFECRVVRADTPQDEDLYEDHQRIVLDP